MECVLGTQEPRTNEKTSHTYCTPAQSDQEGIAKASAFEPLPIVRRFIIIQYLSMKMACFLVFETEQSLQAAQAKMAAEEVNTRREGVLEPCGRDLPPGLIPKGIEQYGEHAQLSGI